MILLIDNYDSFTYNIFQYASEGNVDVHVIRNDQYTIEEIKLMDPESIIISPGPGLPKESGICLEVIQAFYQTKPILGICLGQQAIAEALGGKLKKAKHIMHGKTSLITHIGKDIFYALESPLEAMRYHSYVADKANLPEELEITAESLEDDELMGIRHKEYPVYGVQFHPESIGTDTGRNIIQNFLLLVREEHTQNEKLS